MTQRNHNQNLRDIHDNLGLCDEEFVVGRTIINPGSVRLLLDDDYWGQD